MELIVPINYTCKTQPESELVANVVFCSWEVTLISQTLE